MKPTKVRIQLADRAVKIPRGIIETVLIQVDKFYFLVDFVILDIQPVSNPANEIPVILRRVFLATSNAIINCKIGIVKLSFGNMTLELNVFSLSNQRDDDNEESEHVNIIESLVQYHFINTYESDPKEGILTTSDEPEDCSQVFSLFDKQASASEIKRKTLLLPPLSLRAIGVKAFAEQLEVRFPRCFRYLTRHHFV